MFFVSNYNFGYNNAAVEDSLIRKLVNSGFENIRVKIDEQRVIVALKRFI